MRYLSVCSGIEACSVAWEPLGWTCAGLSEIEAFPRAVLQERLGAVPVDFDDHRYSPQSNVLPLFGDFTKIEEHHVGPIDLLVGGTPCQAFSVAGKRLGLDDPRGHLTLEFLALAKRLRPRWLLWENVPGVLSDDGGRTMGTFLGLVGQLGYRGCYRVLDAQFVRVDGFERAVPQRRRRVFFVGHLGDDCRAFPVLFEPESLRGDPAPRRETGQGVAHDVAPSLVSSGRGVERGGDTRGQDPAVAEMIASEHPYAGTVSSKWSKGAGGPAGDECQNLVAHALRAEGFDASEDGTGRGTPIVPIAFSSKDYGNDAIDDLSPTLRSMGHDGSHANGGGQVAVAIQAGALRENPNSGPDGIGVQEGHAYTLEARAEVQAVAFDLVQITSATNRSRVEPGLPAPTISKASSMHVAQDWAVRRLTPTECLRLQGFPDGWTAITYRGKPAADGPQYKAIGNSMAVNVMRWIGQRIDWADRVAQPKDDVA